MFGLLRPHACHLDDQQKDEHRAFYCGLCQANGQHFGQATRAVHSHDAIFVAVLVDALSEDAAEADSCRCPLLPVVHMQTRSPSSSALRYAASVQMLLGDQWLADKAVDGNRLAAAARPLLGGPVTKASAILEELGAPLDALTGFERVQERVEARGAGPLEAAEPTASALALVFERVADLPGVGAAATGDDSRATLRRLGAALGQTIYLLDALEDLDDDLLGGDFNPCVVDGRIDGGRLAATSTGLGRAHDDAVAALAELPLLRHREILDSVVTARLAPRVRRAREKAEEQATAAHQESLDRYRALPVWHRAALAFWSLLAGMALWLTSSTQAFAASLGFGELPIDSPQARNCCDKQCDKCCDNCKCPCSECGDQCNQCNNCNCPCNMAGIFGVAS